MMSSSRENFCFVRQIKPKGKNYFPLGFHPATHSIFNPVNGNGRKPRLSCKLCFAYKKALSDFSYSVFIQFPLPKKCPWSFLSKGAVKVAVQQPGGHGHQAIDPWLCVTVFQRFCPCALCILPKSINAKYWWFRKKSKSTLFVIPDLIRNPVFSASSGFPLAREWRVWRLFTWASTLKHKSWYLSIT